MTGIQFDEFRRILLDPTPEGADQRSKIKTIQSGVKAAAGAAFAVSALVGTSAIIASIAAPILGGITVLWAGVGCVLSREVFIIADNIVNICSNNVDNILSRGMNALTPDWFVASMFKNTWFAKSCFSSFFVELLNTPVSA